LDNIPNENDLDKARKKKTKNEEASAEGRPGKGGPLAFGGGSFSGSKRRGRAANPRRKLFRINAFVFTPFPV
jgi:hypothetical protein